MTTAVKPYTGTYVADPVHSSFGFAVEYSGSGKFRGTLEKADAGWQLVWSDEPEPQPGVRVSKKKEPAPLQVLGFTLDELKEARLAPIVDFKGRKRAGVQEQGK